MYVSTPWEVKTASCNINPTHSLTFGWVHTLHDSGLIIMITQHSVDTLGNHFSSYFIELQYDNFPKQIHTLIVLFHTVDGSEILHHLGCTIPCKLWDIYPISTGEPDFFHQPYLHESSPEIEDLTPLEIVLDKEAWMDEIPEDEMSGRWDEIMKFWDPQLQLFVGGESVW